MTTGQWLLLKTFIGVITRNAFLCNVFLLLHSCKDGLTQVKDNSDLLSLVCGQMGYWWEKRDAFEVEMIYCSSYSSHRLCLAGQVFPPGQGLKVKGCLTRLVLRLCAQPGIAPTHVQRGLGREKRCFEVEMIYCSCYSSPRLCLGGQLLTPA